MEQNSSTENKDKMLMATVAPITRNEENESNDSRTHQKNNYKLILGSLKGLLLCSIIVVLLTALVIMVIVYPVKIERRILVLQDRIAKLEATLSEETGAEKNSSNMKSNVLQLSENVDQEISALTESLNYNISYMLHHIEELHASINAINRSTRYRYTGCYEDRRSCYLNPVKEDIYYRGCVTPSALTNVSVSLQVFIIKTEHPIIKKNAHVVVVSILEVPKYMILYTILFSCTKWDLSK